MSNQPELNKFAKELSKLVNRHTETPKSVSCDRLFKQVRDLSDRFNYGAKDEK
jgi:hypothetical protein